MTNNETPSEQLTGSIFDRVKDFFTSMWTTLLETDPVIWNALASPMAITASLAARETVAETIKDKWTSFLGAMGLPAEMNDKINNIMATDTFSGLVAGVVMALTYSLGEILAHQDVATTKATQKWLNTYRPTLPDVASLILAMYRDPNKTTEVKDLLHKYGYTDSHIDTMFAASKSIPAPDEYRALFLRGEIDEAQLTAGFKKYGFNDSEITSLKKLFYPIPSYQDLIQMAVREAFYPEYVEEYGLMAELPAEYLEWTAKQGLSEDWAKKYWASHWELPSILRGYEMLHRDVINDEQLDSLFMAQDIMPWWRDKLKAVSYHPLTRVDVRRVYRMGIIDRNQVLRTYLDLGYNDEKAEWLTRFTEMEQGEKERDLSKAEVLSAYTKKILTQSDTEQMLLDLGYSQNEVDVLVSMKDYTEYKANKSREQKRIEKFYMAGAYTANQAINELGNLDMTGAEQNSIMQLWDAQKLAKLRSPVKKDLDGLFSANIISEGDYRTELRTLGYIDKYIEWFVTQVKQKPQEE